MNKHIQEPVVYHHFIATLLILIISIVIGGKAYAQENSGTKVPQYFKAVQNHCLKAAQKQASLRQEGHEAYLEKFLIAIDLCITGSIGKALKEHPKMICSGGDIFGCYIQFVKALTGLTPPGQHMMIAHGPLAVALHAKRKVASGGVKADVAASAALDMLEAMVTNAEVFHPNLYCKSTEGLKTPNLCSSGKPTLMKILAQTKETIIPESYKGITALKNTNAGLAARLAKRYQNLIARFKRIKLN